MNALVYRAWAGKYPGDNRPDRNREFSPARLIN